MTVCGAGLGTSLLLRMAIEDVLADEGLHANVEAWDSGTAKSVNADIIVTTVDLIKSLKDFRGNVVSVNNLNDREEIREKLLPVFYEVKNRIENS